jgi:hypothetical protein
VFVGGMPEFLEGLPVFVGGVPEFLEGLPHQRKRVPENLGASGFQCEGHPV